MLPCNRLRQQKGLREVFLVEALADLFSVFVFQFVPTYLKFGNGKFLQIFVELIRRWSIALPFAKVIIDDRSLQKEARIAVESPFQVLDEEFKRRLWQFGSKR